MKNKNNFDFERGVDDLDFALYLDFDKNAENPARVFESLTKLLRAFQELDEMMVGSISSSFKPILVIDDIEGGSIKVWLKNKLEKINDQDIKELNWKNIIGDFLLKTKYKTLEWLKDKKELPTPKQIDSLKMELGNIAKDSKIDHIPCYSPITTEQIIKGIYSIQQSTSMLIDNDKLYAFTKTEKLEVNINTQFKKEDIKEIVTDQTITNTINAIVKVKKPDYLGQSMWEVIYMNKTIFVKIGHENWLKDFQERKIDVRPMDALRVSMIIEVSYDNQQNEIDSSYTISKIEDVIRNSELQKGSSFNDKIIRKKK